MYIDVKAGVPQGWILGPFMFLICIENFQRSVPSLSVASHICGHDITRLQCEDCIKSVKKDLNRSIQLAGV